MGIMGIFGQNWIFFKGFSNFGSQSVRLGSFGGHLEKWW
jgi:hypothetical protein